MADRRPWLLLPRQLRELPADLAAVLLLVALMNLAVVLPVVRELWVRVALGLIFVLFLPGYAFIAALFPEAGTPTEDTASTTERSPFGDRNIDGLERVALSLGTSIAIVPLVGLILHFTPGGIRLVSVLLAVSAFTLACVVVGARRRWALPESKRFRVPYREWYAAGKAELFQPETRTDAALNVLLVASVLLAGASVGYAVTVPKQGEPFTEFYLLTEDESGELVADGYPEEFERGEARELIVGIGNQEHSRQEYTVVVELQRVTINDETNETVVLDRRELQRFRTTLEHNETWHRRHEVEPNAVGDRLRLQYLLYRGSAPANPTAQTAYRDVHLWVNVSANRT